MGYYLKQVYLLIVFLTLLLFVGCSKQKNENKGKKDFARPVQAGEAIQQSVPNFIESFGYLNAINNVDIKSQVTGEIEKCFFKEGQEVKKGETLFTIDSRVYQAKINELEAQLKSDLTDLKNKQYIVDQDKKLAKTGAIPQQDFVKFMTALEMSQAAVELDKATIVQNEINLEYCTITSPIDGITGKRQVDPGNIVTANTGPTLVNIKSVNPLYVDFTIPEKNLFRLKDAMSKNRLKVIVKVEEFGVQEDKKGALYEGTLEFVNNEVSNQTGTIFLRALIPNGDQRLWPGQFVRVYLVLNEYQNALLVPYIAVQQGLKGYYLFAIKKNKAILHYVIPGQRHDDYIVITTKGKGDIKVGDKIVTVGQMGLAPNVPVNILDNKKFIRPPKEQFYENRIVNKKKVSSIDYKAKKQQKSKQ